MRASHQFLHPSKWNALTRRRAREARREWEHLVWCSDGEMLMRTGVWGPWVDIYDTRPTVLQGAETPAARGGAPSPSWTPIIAISQWFTIKRRRITLILSYHERSVCGHRRIASLHGPRGPARVGPSGSACVGVSAPSEWKWHFRRACGDVMHRRAAATRWQ